MSDAEEYGQLIYSKSKIVGFEDANFKSKTKI
jgi:hypothetical protein